MTYNSISQASAGVYEHNISIFVLMFKVPKLGIKYQLDCVAEAATDC